MKLIKASYEIITPINGEEILKQIEIAARTCYKSKHLIGDIKKCTPCNLDYSKNDTYCNYKELQRYCKVYGDIPIGVSNRDRLILQLIKNSHEAMLEFGNNITVNFICDRGVSHELVRHRLASFAQESTRYCNYGKDEHIIFIIPNQLERINECICTDIRDIEHTSQGEAIWITNMLYSELHYNILMKDYKWTPQQARSVLPNSLKTEINISANIREWRHILKLRTSKAAHPQMRELMCPLLDELKSKIPILFDDITY